MRADDHDLMRDDLAERRRDRDREHEPRGWRRTSFDPRSRQAFQARQVELTAAAVDSSITALECPACLGPVFAPADSHGDRIECANCDARLVTHRSIGGEVTAIPVEAGGAP